MKVFINLLIDAPGFDDEDEILEGVKAAIEDSQQGFNIKWSKVKEAD